MASPRTRVGAVKERLVWIDCEMTGLDLSADALIEVAALVTDFDLNVLGDGIDLVIKPPAEALDQMGDFVRTMHEKSGLLAELDGGMTLAEAEQQVLAYVKEHCPDGTRPPLAGNTVATDRSFLARDMPDARGLPALPDRRRLLDQGAGPALVPPRLLPGPDQARQPPRAGRHPGEHRGAALLPRGRLRPEPRPGQRRRARHRREARRRAHRPAPATTVVEAGARGRFRGTQPDSPTIHVGPGTSRGHMVGVAQLVERRVVVADVAGSSPVTHPKMD